MAEFKSYRSYWHFARETARVRRYIRTPEATAFLDTVAATRHSRERVIPMGRIVWRAQLGHDWRFEKQIDDEMPAAFPPKRMKPLPDRAHEGRVNAKGIPNLYLPTTLETAISEVRPWIGSLVSGGPVRDGTRVARSRLLDQCNEHSFLFRGAGRRHARAGSLGQHRLCVFGADDAIR